MDRIRQPARAGRESLTARRAAHDAVDERLQAWTEGRPRDEAVADLRRLGIPASPVADPSGLLETNPQLRERGYFEAPERPVVGAMPLPSLPFRYAGIDHWLRAPAPTLGRDNDAVLGDILGLSESARGKLEAAGVIGRWPARGTATTTRGTRRSTD